MFQGLVLPHLRLTKANDEGRGQSQYRRRAAGAVWHRRRAAARRRQSLADPAANGGNDRLRRNGGRGADSVSVIGCDAIVAAARRRFL